MKRLALFAAAVCFALCICAVSGCATRPPPPPRPDAPAVKPTPTHEVSKPKITVEDPAGSWTFHVTAARAEAAVADGVYELEAPECRYERSGEPPIFMRADRGHYDHGRKRLLMDGNAYAWSEGRKMVIEASRIEYDLRSGQVVLDD